MKAARQNMLAKVHLAKRDLALSDADYRHVLTVQFGTDSAANLNDRELRRLLDHFRGKGWPPRGDIKPQVRADRRELIDKIEAQLSELANFKGKRVPWSYAQSILRRQTNNPHAYLNWARAEDLTRIVQSLYYQLARMNARVEAARMAREFEEKAGAETLAELAPHVKAVLDRAKAGKGTINDYEAILGMIWDLQDIQDLAG
jgi:hypothetical protein